MKVNEVAGASIEVMLVLIEMNVTDDVSFEYLKVNREKARIVASKYPSRSSRSRSFLEKEMNSKPVMQSRHTRPRVLHMLFCWKPRWESKE